ncbi:MAG: TolC family protein [Bacteroidales bacterium]|nr:TolC family protein [Bacteroidales bacterium]
MKNVLQFIHAIIFTSYISCQPTNWTLSQCIEYAYNHSLDLQLQQINTQILLAQKKQALYSFLPTLSGNFSHAYQYGRTIDPFTNEFALENVQTDNVYLSADLLLFQGFRLINQWKKSKLEYENAQISTEIRKQDIALAIATAYLQILFYTEEYRRSLKSLEITLQQLQKVRIAFEAGQVPRDNLVQMEAQLATEEAQLLNFQNQLQLAKLTLRQLMNLQDTTGFTIVIPDAISLQDTNLLLNYTAESIYQLALQHHPLILLAKNNIQLAIYDLKIARSSLYPVLRIYSSYGTGYSSARKQLSDITVSGLDTVGITTESPSEYVLMPSFSYSYEVIPFRNQWEDNLNRSIGLTLSIPLFHQFSARTNISIAKLNQQNRIVQLEQQQWELKKNIEKAFYDALAAKANYKAVLKQSMALEQVFNSTQIRFETGKATPFEYNDAKMKFQQSLSDLNKAKFELIFRIKILEFYMGKELNI